MAGITSGASTDPGWPTTDSLISTSPTSLHLSVHLTSSGPVITLAGELDVASAPAVKAYLEVFDVHRAPRVVVDVARLSFCDCAGLSVFLRAHRRALGGDGRFRLCDASPWLREMIALAGLASMLRCYPTAADAFADIE